MQLTTKHYYDDETFEHVLSKFYIDGEEVDFESYMDFIGGLEEYNKDEEEKVEDNPYEYVDEDEVCECDECKYKDKKKYESCDDDCKYMNCDECCNDFCDCENDCCECEDCKVEEFDYDELLEIFVERIQETNGNKNSIKSILDEFADNFIEDYDEDEFNKELEDCSCNDCQCTCESENGEFTDEQLAEIDLIEEFTDNVMNIKCGAELRNELYRLYKTGKSIGWNDHCCFMRELMDEALVE